MGVAASSLKHREEYRIPRERMVALLREHYKIADEKVLRAMMDVPRDFFVPSALKAQSYRDNALPIAADQTISQPFIVARMTELLEVSTQSKILEIGAGSGYQTAILAQLAKMIYAVERVPQLAAEAQHRFDQLGIENVSLRVGDGTLGWELYSPFDGILVAAGSPNVPEPLLRQLKIGGKLVLPVGADQRSQRLVRVTRADKSFYTEDFGACSFVPLLGEHGWK